MRVLYKEKRQLSNYLYMFGTTRKLNYKVKVRCQAWSWLMSIMLALHRLR